jgi:hypothetical protein
LPLLTGAVVLAVFQAKYRCVIIDESHALKNHKSKRAKTILPVIRAAKRAILLSGTRTGTNRQGSKHSVTMGWTDLCCYTVPLCSFSVSCAEPS